MLGPVTWLLAVVQKVEIVGGESWLEHNSVAIAAITAAILAATVAVLNHRRQLAHDRSLRNQDHVRDTIDEATKVCGIAYQATIRLIAALGTLEASLKRDPGAPREIVMEARNASGERMQEMVTELTRLEMRLGRKHAVANAYRETLRGIATMLREKVLEPDAETAEVLKLREEREKALNDAYDEYRDACYAWFNE